MWHKIQLRHFPKNGDIRESARSVDVLQNPSTALYLLPLVARSAISSSGQSVMIILQDGKTVNSELT